MTRTRWKLWSTATHGLVGHVHDEQPPRTAPRGTRFERSADERWLSLVRESDGGAIKVWVAGAEPVSKRRRRVG